MTKTNLKRSWFCTCGWTFDEEVGQYKNEEGTEGTSTYYCPNCKQRIEFEWRVIENTDPDDELEEASDICHYCSELKPTDIMHYDYKNYSHPVCDYCVEENSKQIYQVRQSVIVKSDGQIGVVDDVEFENGEWTYRVSFNEIDFGWFGEDELLDKMPTNFDADMDAQDEKWGEHKI